MSKRWIIVPLLLIAGIWGYAKWLGVSEAKPQATHYHASVRAYVRCVKEVSDFNHHKIQMFAERRCQMKAEWDDMFDLDPSTPLGKPMAT